MTKSSLEDKIKEDAEIRGLDVDYEECTLMTSIPWSYTFDWTLTAKSGKKILIESKGALRYFTSDYRKKWLKMYEDHKDSYDIRIIFQHDKLLPHCKSLTTVGWAQKHGIKYHVGENIPEEWINE